MVADLGRLADALAARADSLSRLPDSLRSRQRFPATLGVNDMSLELGGVFDIDRTWLPPHAEHRVGHNADIDVRRDSLDDDYGRAVSAVWVRRMGHTLGDERQSRNHVHLIY